jgi:hypothetical protein
VASKRIERAYLELARSLYTGFPEGNISESEGPDFMLIGSEKPLGIEVRQLFHPRAKSKFTPRQTESFRKKIIRRAEELYYQQQGKPVDVIVYSSLRPAGKQNIEEAARAIADFVRSNYRVGMPVTLFEEGISPVPLPPGVGVVNLAPPLPGLQRAWFAGAVGETVLLTCEFLAEAIYQKDLLVPGYRTKVEQVWLLVVCDLFPSSTSFCVPEQITEWSFEFTFDKVLLLSREEYKVWTLRHI